MTGALKEPTVDPARPTIWRISDRRTFQALRRDGRRARRGLLAVSWLPPAPGSASEPPRVAFAVNRSAGGAVARNRVRRRLRAALRELAANGELPAGSYLLSAPGSVARMPWLELVSLAREAVAEVIR